MDTSKMKMIEQIKELYSDGSKHDNYQNLPRFVRDKYGFNFKINEEWRGDTARYNYLKDNLKFQTGDIISDIGANTGFFTLSLAHDNAQAFFNAYEINENHVKIIKLIAEHFYMNNVCPRVLSVDYDGMQKIVCSDYLLNLNVLHHAGIDFDKGKIESEDDFRNYAVKYLKKIRRYAKRMIFQMGYNWGGNKSKPIVALHDDFGKIMFTLNLFINSGWTVESIAICKKENELVTYHTLQERLWHNLLVKNSELSIGNKLRDYLVSENLQSLSEFYRRPIFILK